MVVHQRIASELPWVGDAVVRLLDASKSAMTSAMPGIASIRSGMDVLRPSLELIADYALQQGLIPRRLTIQA